jgi:hypothetical protein
MKIEVNGVDISYAVHGEEPKPILIHREFDSLDMWYNRVFIY